MTRELARTAGPAAEAAPAVHDAVAPLAAAVAPTAPAALRVTDLRVRFPSEHGPVTAVRGMGFTLQAGEVLGIVGESGSGKSATALAVMGLLPPQALVSGSVQLHGRELLGLGDEELSPIRGRHMAMVFQDPLSALTPVLSAGDQIAEAVLVHRERSSGADGGRAGKRRALARAVELLDLVGIPDPTRAARAFPHELSGGMRQRVMIAMAIANDPGVIIADEPTTALDVTVQAQVLEALATAKEATGAAILLITHDLGVVAGLADRVIVMYAGRPVECGSAEDVFYRPRMPYTLGLLGSIPRHDQGAHRPLTPIEGAPPSLSHLPPGCPFSPRCPLRVDVCERIEPELAPTIRPDHVAACHRSGEIEARGLGAAEVFPAPPAQRSTAGAVRAAAGGDRLGTVRAAAGEPVLAVRGLVRHFPLLKGAVFRRRVGTVHAVDGVSFDLHRGEVLGLVGESGCGKTTTVLEILALARPAAGEVIVLGRDTAALSAGERHGLRREVSVVFQDPLAALDPRMPAGDLLAEPLRAHGVHAAERADRVRDLLRLVGLEPEHASRYPAEFSGGQRQRIGIARALALEPKVLVLDEPVSALDSSIRAGVINLLGRLKAELGLAYVFVSHDLSVVRHLANRVAVMYLGRIVESGAVDQVFDAPAHPYTQALLSAIPLPDPRKERERRRIVLSGERPSPADLPSGCRFRTRCPLFAGLDADRRRRCIEEDPPGLPQDGDHEAACHYAQARAVSEDQVRAATYC